MCVLTSANTVNKICYLITDSMSGKAKRWNYSTTVLIKTLGHLASGDALLTTPSFLAPGLPCLFHQSNCFLWTEKSKGSELSDQVHCLLTLIPRYLTLTQDLSHSSVTQPYTVDVMLSRSCTTGSYKGTLLYPTVLKQYDSRTVWHYFSRSLSPSWPSFLVDGTCRPVLRDIWIECLNFVWDLHLLPHPSIFPHFVTLQPYSKIFLINLHTVTNRKQIFLKCLQMY